MTRLLATVSPSTPHGQPDTHQTAGLIIGVLVLIGLGLALSWVVNRSNRRKQ